MKPSKMRMPFGRIGGTFLLFSIVLLLITNTLLSRNVLLEQSSLLHSALESFRQNYASAPQRDVLCHDCRYRQLFAKVRCGQRIDRFRRTNNMTLAQAARIVAQENPKECGRCDPNACDEGQKLYWRFDDKAPPVQFAVTHYLKSVPVEQRLPPQAFANLTAFLDHPENVYPGRSYFFEYNPSLIQLPQSEQVEIEGETPVYLASFRVSSMHDCIPNEQNVLQMIGGSWPRPPSNDHVGLALLRNDLSIIVDTVIPIKGVGKYGKRWEDYRLFVLHNQIYLTSYHHVLPIWLVKPNNRTDIQVLEPLTPSNLTVMARTFPSCLNDRSTRVYGKNINYFVDKNTNQSMAELYPMADKAVMDMECNCNGNCMKNTNKVTMIKPPSKLPFPSFGTVDELHFSKHDDAFNVLTGDRGSACCVAIAHLGQDLWLGISHSKTRFRGEKNRHNLPGNVAANHFFSSFYAMETTAPYKVVARSGKFCFGFPQEEASTNPYIHANPSPLVIGDTFHCPRVHFVSGMVEKADDPSKIIIAYGVNDCVPRMVVVEKVDIVQMLFPTSS